MPRHPVAQLVLSYLAGFFVAGAAVFPVLNDYYMDRVVYSLGLAGLAYGVESVIRLGHLSACGFLSGNCSEYSVRLAGFVLWIVFFVVLRRRGGPGPPQAPPPSTLP